MPALIGATMTFLDATMISIVPSLPIASPLNKTGVDFFMFLLAMSYVFMIIPSILYALIMEFYINTKVKNDFAAISFSTIFGALTGLFVQLTTIGALTGLLMGIILRSLYFKKSWLKGFMWGLLFVVLLIGFTVALILIASKNTIPTLNSVEMTDEEIKANQKRSVIYTFGDTEFTVLPDYAHIGIYQRDFRSPLKYFNFEVRFPDMAGKKEKTNEQKNESTIYNTMWLGVTVKEVLHYELFVHELFNDVISNIWTDYQGNRHDYKLVDKQLYGLNVYEITGFNKTPRSDQSDYNSYYQEHTHYFHINEQGIVDTHISCSNSKFLSALCFHRFMLPSKNAWVEIHYRIGLLPHWHEIQSSVNKLILSFITNTKNSNNKTAQKP